MQFLTTEQLPINLQQRIVYQILDTGQIIFQQHEPTEAVFVVECGRVRLVSFSEQQIITHYFVEAGESFAETALFSDTYACTAITELPSRIAVIDKELFQQALRDYPDLTNAYMNQLTYRFENVKLLLELRSIRSARERLLQYLIRRIEPSNRTLTLQRPLKYLATELGLSAETLSRTLSHLEEQGLISRKQRSITLNEDW